MTIIRRKFQSKANRDAAAKHLRIMYGKDNVRASSMRNQNLHPQYIEDWEGEVETGFGNTQYNTFFPAIYTVTVEARS